MNFEFKEEASRVIAVDQAGNEAGEVRFTWEGDEVIIIDTTSVKEEHRGQELGDQLIGQVVEKAQNDNLKVMPLCPYAKKQIVEKYQSVLQE